MTNQKKGKEKKFISKGLLAIIAIVLYLVFVIFIGPISIEENTFTLGMFVRYFIIYLAFLLLMIFLFKKDLGSEWKELKNIKKSFWRILLYFVIFFVLSFLIANICKIGVLKLFKLDTIVDATNTLIFKFFNSGSFGIIFGCFFTVIFTPIVDELVFRKALGDGIKSRILFIFISSLLSWYFQVSILSPNVSQFILAIGSLINALFASIIYSKRRNIWYTIIPRMLLNAFSCVMTVSSSELLK